jgi:ribosomal protein S28E/S33
VFHDPPTKAVITIAARQVITAKTAFQHVVAVITDDHVIAGTAVHGIGTARALQLVCKGRTAGTGLVIAGKIAALEATTTGRHVTRLVISFASSPGTQSI